MGYAKPKGKYHAGPKKDTKKRRFNKPTFPKQTEPTTAAAAAAAVVKPTDEALIKVLSQMSDHDMSTFVSATAYPKPTDVLIVRGSNGSPKPIVLDDDDDRQTHSGMVYVAGFGFGGGAPHHVPESTPPIVGVAAIKPTAVKVVPTKTEPKEKVIGEIVRKPNGEIVLRFY